MFGTRKLCGEKRSGRKLSVSDRRRLALLRSELAVQRRLLCGAGTQLLRHVLAGLAIRRESRFERHVLLADRLDRRAERIDHAGDRGPQGLIASDRRLRGTKKRSHDERNPEHRLETCA